MNFISLLILSVTLNVSASIFLKKGLITVGGISGKSATLIPEVAKALMTPLIILGMVFYGLSFLIWLRVLSFNELSKSYPIFASMVFLFTSIASYFIFKENISNLRIIGIIVILTGIFIVSKS